MQTFIINGNQFWLCVVRIDFNKTLVFFVVIILFQMFEFIFKGLAKSVNTAKFYD